MHGGTTRPKVFEAAAADVRPAATEEAVAQASYGPAGDYTGVEHPDGSTAKLNEKLAEWLTSGRGFTSADATDDLPPIPAGYTYLGQLAAHDLTLNSEICKLPEHSRNPVNQRDRPLLLDTLYGNVAGTEPWLADYDPTGQPLANGWPRTRFLMDTVGRQPGETRTTPPHAPVRDVGRRQAANGAPSEALIADERNDDQPMLAQLTAVFQLAHNIAMDALETEQPPSSAAESQRNFDQVRAALTYVYRNILERDYLERLLHPNVYAYYRQPTKSFLDPNLPPGTVSRDFAHAAFRIGHAMIRNDYTFANGVTHNFQTAMRHSSGVKSGETMPLGPDWIIAWSAFFKLNGSSPQMAGLIEPRFSDDLDGTSDGRNCIPDKELSLIKLDLQRGVYTGVRKIPTLIATISERLPELAATSPWLRDPTYASQTMYRWSGDREGHNSRALPQWMRDELSANPPPFLYYLVEAAVEAGGKRVGPLGSVIIADTFFRALEHVSIPTATANYSAEAAANSVFANKVPDTMAKLILWVDARLGAENKAKPGGVPGSLPFT